MERRGGYDDMYRETYLFWNALDIYRESRISELLTIKRNSRESSVVLASGMPQSTHHF